MGEGHELGSIPLSGAAGALLVRLDAGKAASKDRATGATVLPWIRATLHAERGPFRVRVWRGFRSAHSRCRSREQFEGF